MEQIKSQENPRYRRLKALHKPEKARKEGELLLEGLRLCRDAAASGLAVRQVIFTPESARQPSIAAFLAKIPAAADRLCLDPGLAQKLAQTQNPQGIFLVCQLPKISLIPERPCAEGLYLAAEQVQDPGNLGTLIRVADAFAFAGVLLTQGTVWPFNDKVMRASMGSVFHLPLLWFSDLAAMKEWLSRGNIPLIGADLAGTSSFEMSYPTAAALLIGNEAKGLSRQAQGLIDHRVKIPMPGRAESLNAAVAAAILGYELLRSQSRAKAADAGGPS